MYPLHLHCVLCCLTTSSCCGSVHDSATLLSHWVYGTGCWQSWGCCGWPQLFVASVHIPVPIYLWTLRNRLMIVLWCTLGLPVGGAIQMTVTVIVITQPESWYWFCCFVEGRRLNQSKHCNKGAHPTYFIGGCHNKHNCLCWDVIVTSLM